MTAKNISREAFKKIKEEKITPKPKWEFMVKNIIFASVFAISIIIGSLTSSVLIYMIKYNDWDLHKYVHSQFLVFILLTFPYLWLLFFIVFLVVAYLSFRNTKGSYKHRFYIIIVSIAVLSIILGTIFYYFGLGKAIEDTFRNKVKPYRNFMQQRESVWLQPEKGILIGKVISLEKENVIQIIDIGGKSWNIRLEDAHQDVKLKLWVGMPVKIAGEKVDENNFRAKIIRPAVGIIVPMRIYPQAQNGKMEIFIIEKL